MATTSAKASHRANLRILVIDDEEQTRAAISRLLSSHGFLITQSADGPAGIAAARRIRPDLILCDVTMPGMDGYSVLRALKSDPHTAVVPFIFLSGVLDHDFVRQGMGLGADDYVTKPFQTEHLLDSIRARIERQRVISQKLDDLRLNLARSVPNEFLTPLNSILGFSMLLLDSLRAGEEIKRDDLEDSLEGVYHAGEQLLRIASNYVLFTQLASRETPLNENTPVLAGEAWVPVVSRCVRTIATEHGRIQDVHFGFQPANLAINEQNLGKIIRELLDNAFKFSHRNQMVRANGFCRDGSYVFQISDRGCGMTAEQIESLDPMMQIDRVRRVQSGVGLGLAICQLLAAHHGGSLSIQPNPQAGVLVEVMLPLASAAD